MYGCKRKLSELEDGPESASPNTRRARHDDSRLLGHEAPRMRENNATFNTRNAGPSHTLDSLPAEILYSIFTRCRNPCLSHVSSRLHRALPPFHETSRSLAGFAMAALPFKDRNGDSIDPSRSPVWHIARELYGSTWVDCPNSIAEHSALQKEVSESSWFSASIMETTHLTMFRRLVERILLDKGFFAYLTSNTISRHQRFRLSNGQKTRVQQFIKTATEIDYRPARDLNLRTENEDFQSMQIDVRMTDISFCRRNRTDEAYLISSFDYLPSFIYNAPLTRRTGKLLSLVQISQRGDPRVPDYVVLDDGRELCCSRDKLKGMIDRVIDDHSNPETPELLRQLLWIDMIYLEDGGQASVVEFDMFRRAAFLDRKNCLHELFHRQKQSERQLLDLVTEENVKALENELRADGKRHHEVRHYLCSISASLFCKKIEGPEYKAFQRRNKARKRKDGLDWAQLYDCAHLVMKWKAADADTYY